MSESARNINSARNIIYIIIKHVFLLFLNFLTKTIFIKVLGKEFLGLNGLFYNIFLLFTYAEAGIGTAMTYSLYKPFAVNDDKKCAALYYFFRKIYWIMSCVVFLAGIAVIPFLGYLVDLDMPMGKVVYYYLLYIISTLISNLYIYKSYILTADQKQYVISKIQVIFEAACFLLQMLVLYRWQSFELYLLCVILKFAAISYYMSKEVKVRYSYDKYKREKLSQDEKTVIHKNMKTLCVYKFSKAMINSTDNIIISMIVGTVWIGYYSNYDFVILGIFGFVTAFYSAISASVGNLIVEKTKEAQYSTYKIIEMINFWLSGFTSTCLLVLFQDFITLWIGKSYQLNMTVVVVIVLNYHLRCLRESTSMFREAAGMFTKFKNITLVTAILNIVLSFLFGYWFGLIGILGATAISILATYFWYEPYLVFQELFHRPVIPYFAGQLKNLLITLFCMAVTLGISGLLAEVTIITFIIKILLCVLIVNLVYFLFYRKTSDFQTLFEIGKGLFIKKRTGKRE